MNTERLLTFMQTQLTKALRAKIDAFKAALQSASDELITAGKLLVEMLAENENTFEILLTECPGSTLAFLESLERVGLGQLNPLLLTDPSPAAQRALNQVLPMEEQERLINNPIPVVVQRNGGFKTEQKRMTELNTQEAYRVIGEKHLRTTDEQIVILREQTARAAARDLRYEIRGDRIIFHDETPWKWSDLEPVLDQIRPKPVEIEASMKQNQIAK